MASGKKTAVTAFLPLHKCTVLSLLHLHFLHPRPPPFLHQCLLQTSARWSGAALPDLFHLPAHMDNWSLFSFRLFPALFHDPDFPAFQTALQDLHTPEFRPAPWLHAPKFRPHPWLHTQKFRSHPWLLPEPGQKKPQSVQSQSLPCVCHGPYSRFWPFFLLMYIRIPVQ